ncbi:ubiquitin-binding protein CUE2 [Podospora conica]|nr:ubiquitin-binding protein CUE2 [Schizothecium conicum]
MGGRKSKAELRKQSLLKEFVGVLDEPLVLSILGDVDLQKYEVYQETRGMLASLAESATVEKATGFDPSGTGCKDDSEDGHPADVSTTSRTDLTEDATTISESSESEAPLFTHRPNLSEDEKVESLLAIFSLFKDHTVRFVLKSCDWDLERAFDELLNRQALEKSGFLPKGVDGFLAMEHDWGPRAPPVKAPRRTKSDRCKISLPLDFKVVSSTIDDSELESAPGTPSPTSRRLLSRSESSALPPLRRSTSTGGTSLTHVSSTPQLPSMDHFELQTPRPERTTQLRTALPDLSSSRLHQRQAASLARLGPLGRIAAAVYTERAREAARQSLDKTATMAEQLVNQHSTATKIDLHGVTVLDGVRIAKHRVWQWWDNLGEGGRARVGRGGADEGFTVVTGIGKHSQGGVSRLRQAVGAALKNDGWKVEVLTGRYCVTGRA